MPTKAGIPTLADLIGMANQTGDDRIKREHDFAKMEKEKELNQLMQQENLRTAQDYLSANQGPNKRASISLSPGGGVNLGGGESSGNDMGELIKLLSLKALMEERENKQVEKLQDDVTKSGAPQAIESLRRVNQQMPGVFQGKAKPKSVGGWKNIIPNVMVPVAEHTGLMDPGSSDERAAIQEAMNAKLYDASGKSINEAEMERIKAATGLSGMFNQSAFNDAMKQLGDTVARKNINITAGYQPKAVQTFKQRGGVAGKSLEDLLGAPAAASAAPDAVDPQMKRYLELKNKYRR